MDISDGEWPVNLESQVQVLAMAYILTRKKRKEKKRTTKENTDSESIDVQSILNFNLFIRKSAILASYEFISLCEYFYFFVKILILISVKYFAC